MQLEFECLVVGLHGCACVSRTTHVGMKRYGLELQDGQMKKSVATEEGGPGTRCRTGRRKKEQNRTDG